MAEFPQSIAEYIAGLSDEDFINGGHRTNFIPTGQGTAVLAQYVEAKSVEFYDYAEQAKTQVAADAEAAAAGSGTEASAANIRAGTSAQYMSIRRSYAAAAPVALADGANVAIDFATGINFSLAIGGNRTLAAPTNLVAGKSGIIIITQDATGGWTLAKVPIWKVLGGEFVLDAAPGGKTVLSYYIESEASILVTGSEGFA